MLCGGKGDSRWIIVSTRGSVILDGMQSGIVGDRKVLLCLYGFKYCDYSALFQDVRDLAVGVGVVANVCEGLDSVGTGPK